MNILVPYQIDVVKLYGLSYKKTIFILYIFFLSKMIRNFEDGNIIKFYEIIYFLYKINWL